jgi:hypothetical protein
VTISMGITFRWDDEARTLLRFSAEGEWNWKDYHHMARVASFNMFNAGGAVDVIFDLRGGVKLPSGAVAHLRTVGKRLNERMTGRAAIIGLDAETTRQIAPDGTGSLTLGDQTLYFVDDDAAAYAALGRTPER